MQVNCELTFQKGLRRIEFNPLIMWGLGPSKDPFPELGKNQDNTKEQLE